MIAAYKNAEGLKLQNRRLLIDVERGRTVKEWKPRRLGGGLGGRPKAVVAGPSRILSIATRIDAELQQRLQLILTLSKMLEVGILSPCAAAVEAASSSEVVTAVVIEVATAEEIAADLEGEIEAVVGISVISEEVIVGTSITIAEEVGEASMVDGVISAAEEVKVASTAAAAEAIEEISTTLTTLDRQETLVGMTADEGVMVEIGGEGSEVVEVISAVGEVIAVGSTIGGEGSKLSVRRIMGTGLVRGAGWVEVGWVEEAREWEGEEWAEGGWEGEEGRSETEAEWTVVTAIRNVRDINCIVDLFPKIQNAKFRRPTSVVSCQI